MFSFNDEKVKNEIATISEILESDYKLLALGFSNDPATDVKNLSDKLKAAGIEKVYAEMQTQINEFLAQ